MQRAEETIDDRLAAQAAGHDARSSHSPVSVAILAALAFMPIVVAAGFLTDRPAVSAMPGDISVPALRGMLDAGNDRRPEQPARAGY